jgi:tetratricopeptide (TPR) repeat protein
VILKAAILRRAQRLIAVALVGGTLAGCLSESKRHFDRARILFERRDLNGAKVELTQAIQADPDLLEAHKLMARVDEYLGDQQDAALEYETAARLDPADPRVRNKARFYRRQLDRRMDHFGDPGPTPAPARAD